MKSRLQLLQDESLRIGLEQNERDSLRESLMAYIDKNPVHESDTKHSHRPSFFSPFLMRAGIASLILVVGAGVAYAAESSVPGDSMYSIKRGVNEKVLGAFAFSDSSKAELEVDFAARRLVEAEKLNTNARLTSETKAALVNDFNIHMKAMGKHVERLAAEKKFADVKKATTHLESSLNAHAHILPTLSLVGTQAQASTSSSITSTSSSTTTPSDVQITNVSASSSVKVKSQIKTR